MINKNFTMIKSFFISVFTPFKDLLSKIKVKNKKKNIVGELELDIYESDKELLIIAPLAGVSIEDVSVVLEEGVLKIRGERQMKVNYKRKIANECFWGVFARSVVLPSNIKFGNIKAVYKNGILEIYIPKICMTKHRKIKVSIS